ncbi:MAG TPA: hypothetical protein VJV78_31805 [Polyangiales bacterium]|nr:hypothetical protein [Polyangiales bacterium]
MEAWTDGYIELEIHDDTKLVRQKRTAKQYESVAVLQSSTRQLVERMRGVSRGEYCLLHDIRSARGRAEPDFEAAIVREVASMSDGFKRLAVLVATQVGRLQVKRLRPSADRQAVRIFLDESEALQWLREP